MKQIAPELAMATQSLLNSSQPAKPTRQGMGPFCAAAICLSALPVLAQAAEVGEWDIDTAILFYSEPDRVTAIEPVISGTRLFADDRSLTAKLVIDGLTGASPNGAVPSSQAQTYTRASGEGQYTTPSGEVPLDDTFRDTRIALSAGWSQPIAGGVGDVGLNLSNEYDYLSLGVNMGYAYSFAKNNATLSFGLGYAADTIEPEGGIPVEGACLFGASASSGCTETSFEQTRDGSQRDKDTLDLLLGYTQVLGRGTVAQFNLSVSQSDGYHNDPFKVISVVDTDNSEGNGVGEPERHLHERRRPDRTKQGLFARVKHLLFGRDVLDASYRYQTDDWGLTSHTLDLRYRWAMSDSRAFTPHLRLYQQGAIDDYRAFLRDDEPLPTYYTADYRQGDFTGITLGGAYEWTTRTGRRFETALEYYVQDGDDPANAVGQLQGREVFPDLEAVMLRFNFDFDW